MIKVKDILDITALNAKITLIKVKKDRSNPKIAYIDSFEKCVKAQKEYVDYELIKQEVLQDGNIVMYIKGNDFNC